MPTATRSPVLAAATVVVALVTAAAAASGGGAPAAEHATGGVRITTTAVTWIPLLTPGPGGRGYDAGAATATVAISVAGTSAPLPGAEPLSEPFLLTARLPMATPCPAAPGGTLPDGSAIPYLESEEAAAVEVPPLYDVAYDLARPGTYRICAYVQQDYEDETGVDGAAVRTIDTGDATVTVPEDRVAEPFAGDRWDLRNHITTLTRRPSRITLGAANSLGGLTWTRWRGARARATGSWAFRARAGGMRVTRRARVRAILDRPVRCRGLSVYTRLTVRALPPAGARPRARTRSLVRVSPATRRACARA